jgi:hypothetical protein
VPSHHRGLGRHLHRRCLLCGPLLLASSGELAGQIPGIPVSVVRNATVPRRTLPTVSLESGHYRHRVVNVTPLAVRAAVDRTGLTVSAGYSWLLSHSDTRRNGHGVGVGLAFDLWPSGRTSYFAFGGRLAGGIGFSSFPVPGGEDQRQVDIPLALAFAHKLPPLTLTVLPWIAPRIQPRVIDDGDGSDLRWLAGGSAGIEVVKARCGPGQSCVYGWGVRVSGEVITDVEGGRPEWGVAAGLLWKFF